MILIFAFFLNLLLLVPILIVNNFLKSIFSDLNYNKEYSNVK